MVIYMWIGSYKWVNEKRETETHRTDATTTKKMGVHVTPGPGLFYIKRADVNC